MSSTESEQSENQMESEDDEQQNLDLDASDTDSDEDDDHSENADEKSVVKPKSLKEKVEEQLQKKYAERQGKQLHIRFPHKLPEDEVEFQKEVKALSPLIVKAHKPRQKYARFCLADFDSREERDTALQTIKAASKGKEAKIVASIPRTESAEFIDELVQRKVNTLEKKRAKARLRRETKLALRAKNFTSSIVITNLPQSASVAEVRKLFPNAVDVQIKPNKNKLLTSSIAVVTLPTTIEARTAVKQKYSLGGTQLVVRFDSRHSKKGGNKPKKETKHVGPILKNKNVGPILKKQNVGPILKKKKIGPTLKKKNIEPILENKNVEKDKILLKSGKKQNKKIKLTKK